MAWAWTCLIWVGLWHWIKAEMNDLGSEESWKKWVSWIWVREVGIRVGCCWNWG